MAVHDGDRRCIRDADMVGLDTDELAILLMGVVDALISTTSTGLHQQPPRGQPGGQRARDIANGGVGREVGDKEVEGERGGDGVGREEEVDDSHFPLESFLFYSASVGFGGSFV